MRPSRSTAFCTVRSTDAGSETSHASTPRSSFKRDASAAKSLLAFASIPKPATRAPPCARRSAIARPIPVVPVTTAALLENSLIAFAILPKSYRFQAARRERRTAARESLLAIPLVLSAVPQRSSQRCPPCQYRRPVGARDRAASESPRRCVLLFRAAVLP